MSRLHDMFFFAAGRCLSQLTGPRLGKSLKSSGRPTIIHPISKIFVFCPNSPGAIVLVS